MPQTNLEWPADEQDLRTHYPYALVKNPEGNYMIVNNHHSSLGNSERNLTDLHQQTYTLSEYQIQQLKKIDPTDGITFYLYDQRTQPWKNISSLRKYDKKRFKLMKILGM